MPWPIHVWENFLTSVLLLPTLSNIETVKHEEIENTEEINELLDVKVVQSLNFYDVMV